MKRFICFIVIGVLLMSSIPIYAEDFNDGPEPTNPYYAKFKYEYYNKNASGVVTFVEKDLWLYADKVYEPQGTIHIKLYGGGELQTSTSDTINQYWNGSTVKSGTSWIMLISPNVCGTVTGGYPSNASTFAMLNNGLFEANYSVLSQGTANYKLYLEFSTINFVDTDTGIPNILPKEPPIPDYVNESKVWITMGNSTGNNPLATIIVRYKLDQRFIGDLGDWKFKLLSTPDRYMKVTRHTPLDYMYPQPSLFRYGEIEYQGLSIEGQNKFFAQATNALMQTQLTSLPWVYDYYKGFIDVNLDGQDDRFNSGDDSQGAIPDDESLLVDSGTLPVRTDYEDGILGTIGYFMDLIFTYISTPFKWIATSLQTMANWLVESMGWITSINAFFGAFFSYLPTEITGAISVLVFVIVIFAILKVMRG